MRTRKSKLIIALIVFLALIAGLALLLTSRVDLTQLTQKPAFPRPHTEKSDMTYNSVLAHMHKKIRRDFADISHLDAKDLKALAPRDYLIFDVREKDEFEVSHLENAIWVDPDISAADFIKLHGDKISDKKAVFYCSVGVRSSRLVKRLNATQNSAQTHTLYNLENGIFGWHNQHETIYQKTDITPFIHPYNQLWKKGINRKELTRYK